ncbi:MAG: MaoC/PaaZ C-terminal domain-containing protein [Spongiibacter sp.]
MNLDALRHHQFDAKLASYSDRDTMLYALSLGAASPPYDTADLPLVYEKNLKCLPTIAAVLGHPGAWMSAKKFDVTMTKLLHGEQRIQFHAPLPPTGDIRCEYHVPAVVDKGAEKGALMYFDKVIYDQNTEEKLCTVSASYFLRADGGCGSFGQAPVPLEALPDTPADFTEEVTIDPRAALFYRLNGDRNPLHADPDIAQKAGFSKPILHGLCTYGMCGLTLTRKVLDYNVERATSLGLRFSAPVYPGETLLIEGWRFEGRIGFRATVKQRGTVAVNNGWMTLRK